MAETIRMTVTALPDLTPPNLVANPGFETDLAGWETVTGTFYADTIRSSTQAQAGSWSMRVDTVPEFGVGALINVKPGRSCTLSLYVHQSAAALAEPRVWLPDGTLLAYGSAAGNTNMWVQLSVDFTGPAGGQVYVGVGNFSFSNTGTLYVDSVSVPGAPQPNYEAVADGADTASPVAVLAGASYQFGDRVVADLRTPQMPLVTGKVDST